VPDSQGTSRGHGCASGRAGLTPGSAARERSRGPGRPVADGRTPDTKLIAGRRCHPEMTRGQLSTERRGHQKGSITGSRRAGPGHVQGVQDSRQYLFRWRESYGTSKLPPLVVSIDSHPRAKVSFSDSLHYSTKLMGKLHLLFISCLEPNFRRNRVVYLRAFDFNRFRSTDENPHSFVSSVAAVASACYQAAPSSGGIFGDTARFCCGTS